jgi:hypothetical protein
MNMLRAFVLSCLGGQLAAQDTAWLIRDVSVRPSPRAGHVLAFQDHTGRTVLFGGGLVMDETWQWDGQNWNFIPLATRPAPQVNAAMAYDSDRRRTVFFGGNAAGYANDTWEWDGTIWLQRSPQSRPRGRANHSMVYDRFRRRTVLYGGLDDLGNFLDDTWTWDGTDWTLVAAGSPPGRYWHAMAFDEARDVTVLFGGGSSQMLFNDTWEWNGSAWRNATVLPAPRARVGHAMAYHAVRQRVVLFAGHAMFGGGVLNETLEWDGASQNWVPIFPLATPGPKWQHRMVYDRWRSRMVVFGGFNNFGPLTDETWSFSEVPLTATPAQPAPGQTITLLLNSVRDPGAGYVLACSFSRVPGIPAHPDGRVVSLGLDPLLQWSVGSLVPPFLGFLGGLNASGWAQASILLPTEPALAGLRFFVSGLTYDTQSVRTVLNEVELRVRSP